MAVILLDIMSEIKIMLPLFCQDNSTVVLLIER